MEFHTQKIISDQGTEFTATIFRDFCKQYNIHHHITSFQQTGSNGLVERFHSAQKYRIIRKQNQEKDHEDILNEAVITYNDYYSFSNKIYSI